VQACHPSAKELIREHPQRHLHASGYSKGAMAECVSDAADADATQACRAAAVAALDAATGKSMSPGEAKSKIDREADRHDLSIRSSLAVNSRESGPPAALTQLATQPATKAMVLLPAGCSFGGMLGNMTKPSSTAAAASCSSPDAGSLSTSANHFPDDLLFSCSPLRDLPTKGNDFRLLQPFKKR